MNDANLLPEIKLTPEQQQLCHRTIRYLRELGAEIQKVSKCGVDCAPYEALRQRLLEVNEEIAKNYCKPHELVQ